MMNVSWSIWYQPDFVYAGVLDLSEKQIKYKLIYHLWRKAFVREAMIKVKINLHYTVQKKKVFLLGPQNIR